MSNDPRDLDGEKLKQALLKLGRYPALRQELIDWLKKAENTLDYSGSVRDDVSGPIIDALHTDDDRYEKTLADGTRYEFLYRTKIARDFLLAKLERPTHVWEPQTTRLLRHLAAQTHGDVLIGGAYFGDHAILLGKQLAADGRMVHCFEPNDAQSGMLARNMAINHLHNLQIQRLGLWDLSSQRLRLDGFDSFANVVVAAAEEDGFQTIRIDDYCQAQNAHLGVIMLDIEGAELRALQGAARVLEQDRPAVVFEVHRDYVDWSQGLGQTPICTLLSVLGYQMYAVRDFNSNQEMGDRLIELVPVDRVYLEGPPHGFNMVAVPNPEWVAGALFRVVPNVSPKLLKHRAPELHHPLEGYPD